MASSKLSSPSLYDDDDIVDTRRHSSSGSSHHHHHHHHHSTGIARLQGSVDSSYVADEAARNIVRFTLRLVIFIGLSILCYILWQKNRDLESDLANRDGTNAILVEKIAKLEADQKNLLLEIEQLEKDKADMADINAALREAVSSALGGGVQ